MWVQVLLFTATMTEELREVAQQWQQEPVAVNAAADGACISNSVVQVRPPATAMTENRHSGFII